MKCRFCPDKIHSEKCGKCKPCCDADGYMAANVYHLKRGTFIKRKRKAGK